MSTLTEEQILLVKMLGKIINAIRDADRGTIALSHILVSFKDENIPASLKNVITQHYKDKGWDEAWWHGDGFNLRRSQ